MKDLMRQAKLKEPIFQTDEFFRVIFYRDPRYSMKPEAQKTREKTREKFREKTRDKVLKLMKDNPEITTDELAGAIGISRKGIEWQISKLKKEKVVKRIGPARGGHWQVLGKK